MSGSNIERFVQSGLSGKLINEGQKLEQKLREFGVVPTGLSDDSRRVKKGDIFFAYPGTKQDGRIHINEAIELGCSVVIWERVLIGSLKHFICWVVLVHVLEPLV